VTEGERKNFNCEVRSIYQGFLFLQSNQITKNQGICVEKADTCKVINEVAKKPPRTNSSNQNNKNEKEDRPGRSDKEFSSNSFKTPYSRINDR
jgi:hypothetical protein